MKEATFYHWNRHYFEVVGEGDKNLARCTLCSPSSKPLSCARNMTSNFKKHLAGSVHKSMNLVVVLPESVGGVEWKRPVGDNGDSGSKRVDD